MGRDSNQQLKTLRLKLKIPSDQQDLLQKLSWNDEGSGRNTGNSLDDVHLPPSVLENLLNAHCRNKEFESKRLAATKARERVTTQEQLSTPAFQTQIITNDQDQSPQPPPPSPPSSSGDLTSWASSHYDKIDKGDSSPCSEGSIGSEPAPKDANDYVNHDLRNTSPEPDETLANPQELAADAPRSSSIPELSVVVPQPLYSRKAIEPRIAIIQERSPESNPASPNESTRKEKKSDQTPLRYQNSPTPSSKPPQVSLCQSSARQSQYDAQSQLEARKAPVTGATTVVPAHSLRQSVAIDAPPCAQRLISLSPHSLAEVEVEEPKRKSRPGRMNMPAFTQTQSCSEAPLLPVEPSIRSTMPSSQISSPVLRSRNPPLHSQTCITETPLVALKQANPPVLADLQSSPPVSLRTKAAHTPSIATPRIDFSRAAPSSVPNPELVVPCSAVTRSIDRQSIETHNRVSHLDTSVIEKTQRQPSALLSISRSNNRKRKAYVHSSYEQSPKERTIDRPLPEASLLTNSHPYATRTSQVVSCCSPNSASAPVPGPGPRPTNMIAPRSSSIKDFTLQLGMSPYDWFCSIYPEFVATHSSFANGIRYLVYLRNGKRLPECLYDDMLRAFTMEFPLYVSRTKKPMPAISWYMDRLDTPTYQSRAITHSNIDDIYLVTFGFPSDSTSSHHVSREAEEPASVIPHAKRRRVEVTSPSDYFIPPTMPAKLPSSTERTQIIPPSQPAINQPLAPKPTTGTRATSGQYSDSFPPGEQSSGQVPARLPDGVSTTHASADALVNDSVKTIQTAFPQREEPPTPLPSTPPHPMITRSRCSSPHHASVHRVSSHGAGKNKDACSSPPLAKAVPTDFQQRPSRARRVSAAVQKKKISLPGAQKRIKTLRKSVAMDWSMMDESSFLA